MTPTPDCTTSSGLVSLLCKVSEKTGGTPRLMYVPEMLFKRLVDEVRSRTPLPDEAGTLSIAGPQGLVRVIPAPNSKRIVVGYSPVSPSWSSEKRWMSFDAPMEPEAVERRFEKSNRLLIDNAFCQLDRKARQ